MQEDLTTLEKRTGEGSGSAGARIPRYQRTIVVLLTFMGILSSALPCIALRRGELAGTAMVAGLGVIGLPTLFGPVVLQKITKSRHFTGQLLRSQQELKDEIAEHERTEQALRESEKRFSLAIIGDITARKHAEEEVRTCVDRASRYLMARKVKTCTAEPVAERLRQTIRKLPASKRHTLTLDNGREFARPVELERRLSVQIFFAHPYHAWERGTNENTNGLLRQYLPRSSDLAVVTDKQLRSYVCVLNHRPRKCLGCQTPFEVFHHKPPG